jgi:tetratricopeptide (TPR) repeat protein
MKTLRQFIRIGVLGCLVVVAGCAPTKEAARVREESAQNKRMDQKLQEALRDQALSHFIDGAVFDVKGEYANAILEYQEAVKDDPSPAIYYAISKDYSLLGKHAPAAESGREAVRLDSTNIVYRENLAAVYLNAFQPDKAIEQYEAIVRIDSNYTTGWFNLARLYQTSRPLRALEIYQRILDQNGDDWDVLLQMAEIYNSLGQFDKAAEKYRRMVELDPSNRVLQRQLAEVYARAGNFKEATKVLENILEVDQNDPDATAALADVYLDQRDFPRAVELYEKLLNRVGDNPEIKLRVGIAYFGQIQRDSTFIDKAKPIFQEVNKEVPNDWRPNFYLGIIAATEKQDSLAETYFERSTQLAPWNGDAWWSLGTTYFQNAKYEKLLDAMEQAKKAIPKDSRFYFLTGLAYSRLNEPEKAVPALEYSLALKPNDLDVLSTLALTLDGMHRYQESDSLYELSLKIDPQYHLVLNNYSYSLAERGLQLERALQMALQAIAAEPDNASYLDTVGWIYFRLGRYEEAQRYIAKAIDAGGASATVYEHMGDICSKLGQKENAERYWKQALDMDATNQTLRDKLARGSL